MGTVKWFKWVVVTLRDRNVDGALRWDSERLGWVEGFWEKFKLLWGKTKCFLGTFLCKLLFNIYLYSQEVCQSG